MLGDNQYEHLGRFSDWINEAHRQIKLYPAQKSRKFIRKKLERVLGFCKGPEIPQDVKIDTQWEKDGIIGEEISWWVGYGPRTQSWFLYPANAKKPLPGILALHDHGGFKYYGKEKIAEGPNPPTSIQISWWQHAYGGRPYVNALAKAGFAVLVHDTFLWGSRRFLLADIPEQDRALGNAIAAARQQTGEQLSEIDIYNIIAGLHEHTIEKYCNLLGTTLAGVVSHEDRIALNFLASRPEISPNHLGCIGLSGGGNRSALLLATNEKISAAVITGLMSTYADLLDHNVVTHTWMLFPSNWARHGDWPDIAASRAPMPLLIQYDNEDELFTLRGMQKAHQKIMKVYQRCGYPEAYRGIFYPGPHKFDIPMQDDAIRWFKSVFSTIMT